VIGCDQFLAELGDYLEGEVASGVRQQIEYHLSHCRTCQLLYDSTNKAVNIVTDSGSFALPSHIAELLLEKIMSRIRSEGAPEPDKNVRRNPEL
jgi:hypothetical protein